AEAIHEGGHGQVHVAVEIRDRCENANHDRKNATARSSGKRYRKPSEQTDAARQCPSLVVHQLLAARPEFAHREFVDAARNRAMHPELSKSWSAAGTTHANIASRTATPTAPICCKTGVNYSDATRVSPASRAAIWRHSLGATLNRRRSGEKNSDAVLLPFIRPSAACAFDASR